MYYKQRIYLFNSPPPLQQIKQNLPHIRTQNQPQQTPFSQPRMGRAQDGHDSLMPHAGAPDAGLKRLGRSVGVEVCEDTLYDGSDRGVERAELLRLEVHPAVYGPGQHRLKHIRPLFQHFSVGHAGWSPNKLACVGVDLHAMGWWVGVWSFIHAVSHSTACGSRNGVTDFKKRWCLYTMTPSSSQPSTR